ncbi:MAG: threonine ammonia-lyase [Rhizobiaceae bacterium]|jgi:threonine dehydratase
MTEFAFDVSLDDIKNARERLGGRVRRTPLYVSEPLSTAFGCEVAVKLECLQLGGSFKIRGVLNKLLGMGENERTKGIATVSGGNHAIGVALAAKLLGIPAVVMMAKGTPVMNVEATRAHGAEVVLASDVTEAFRLAQAEEAKGKTFVHPYDDPAIIAGHGTLGLEIADEYDPTHVFLSIGGGGFMAGVGAAIAARLPRAKIYGVETEGAGTMTAALEKGEPVPIVPTSVVKTLGAPFATDRTLAAARLFLKKIITVSDEAAIGGVFTLLSTERVVCEPAAGCLLPDPRMCTFLRILGSDSCCAEAMST